MSVSLYYTAKRDYPITEQEQNNCQKIADQYIAEYPLGNGFHALTSSIIICKSDLYGG
ncbi:MAG: hypothetical protein HFJ04_13590 [Lachnospiraceae bacterium]|nr:hypothetical protein [Lachnospiraceae bacterium]